LYDQLHRYVDEFQLLLIAIHDELALRYFAACEESPAVSNDPGTAARAIAERQPPPGEIATVREAITAR